MDDNVAQTDIGDGLRTSRTPREETYDFTKHVASYFGAYVGGMLSASGLPLRTYGGTYENGVIRKLALEKYPQLNKNIYKNLVTGLGQQTFVVTQNKYTSQPDDRVYYAARENIMKLKREDLRPLFQTLASQASAKLVEPEADRKDIVEGLLEAAQTAIEYDFVVPFVLPFHSINIDIMTDKRAKDSHAILREAAVSRLHDANRETLRHVYEAYLASTAFVSKDSLMATLADALSLEQLKDSLETCIDDLYIGDAYQHIYALHRAAQVADDRDMYVYFCELRYGAESYPLFYTKVMSKHTLPSVTLAFENRILVNKQAIEHVVRRFAGRMNRAINIDSLAIPQAIDPTDTVDGMQRLITKLCDILGLSGEIMLAKTAEQSASNHLLSLSNDIYLYVEAPSATAIADDYAEITTNSDVHKKAKRYLNSLLVKPSGRFVEEINESWQQKTHFEKLLPLAPLSVNDEQGQVLMALSRAGSERIVVDAPDSTGKRHLVHAATLEALSKGQTVLVVGDTPAIGAQIRRSVGETLLAMSGRRGHNPVLDIRDFEVLEHMDDQAVADIAASVRLVEGKSAELATAKKRKKQALKDGLSQLVQGADNINLHEVEQTILNERRFAGVDWVQDEPVEAISADLQKLHRAVQYVRSSDAGYLMPYVESAQRKSIDEFIGAYREYERASRNVQSRLPKFIVRYRKLLPEQRKQLQESLAYVQSNYRQFIRILKEQPSSSWLAVNDANTFQEVTETGATYDRVLGIARGANGYFKFGNKAALLHELDGYGTDATEIIEALDAYIEQVATLKSKLFGFSGRMLVVENLNKQLLKSLPSFNLPEPEKQVENMQAMSDFLRHVTEELAAAGLSTRFWKNVVRILLTDDDHIEEVEQILESLGSSARFDFMTQFKLHEADNLLANITLLEFASELTRVYREFPKISKLVGLTTINHLLVRPHEFTARVAKLSRDLTEASQLNDAKRTIKEFTQEYPDATKRLGIRFGSSNLEVFDDTFANIDGEYVKEYVSHKRKEQDVREFFDAVVTDSFADTSIEYQQILGVELQHMLNGNFLRFVKENGQFITSFAESLRQRRKLSAIDASRALKLFPCVATDVRGLSSIFPLGSDQFDLVIVESADSLTIAEVLPAALRAKKLLVIGDSQQTSEPNEPLHAATNLLFTDGLSAALRVELASESADTKNTVIAKQEATFLADKSALEFFRTYANYDISFKKQYGTYEELAAFSNRYYYDSQPVSLMSRTMPLAEVIKFSDVSPSKDQVTRFTNAAEVEYIVEHLQRLKDQGYTGTISVVTPFAEQAVLLQKELDECVITDWFEQRHLRVMTFDDRRNHTSDYTYYSFVASSSFNEIAQKLPSAIGFDAFPGDTRSHRLLAGFNGSKQTAHFVHSMPIENYSGALGETLKFYNSKVRGSVSVKGGAATDVLQAAETNIDRAVEKTNFVKKYEDRLSFMTKYPFANYIKPLSPDYQKPLYKMYFLVEVDARPIVIEFDDFRERFLQNTKEDTPYLSPQDIYGYKLLEGYGYRFLRLNKFNIGSDPVRTLDTYLNDLVRVPSWPADNGFVA